MFVSKSGQPFRHGNFYARHFKPAVKRSLPPEKHGLRFHDLRHTAASLMISVNPNPKVIQERLGHSSINVTYDRYGHLFSGWDETLADQLDSLRAPDVPTLGSMNRDS